MMPVIEPLDAALASERGLLDLVARGQLDDRLFVRILGHVPGYAEAIHEAMSRSHGLGNVDHRLKEIIRIQLARTAGDPYFAALRSRRAMAEGLTEERIEAGSEGFDEDPHFSDAEKWALRYAYLMYRQPERVDRDFYDEGKKHYTEAQIMELGGMIALHYGMQMFMRTLCAPRADAAP